MTVLQARDLCVEVDGVRRVVDLSLDLEPGRCVGLIGRSGAGKSTVARALVGLEPGLSGSLRFEGSELVGAKAGAWLDLRRVVQLVWQHGAESLDPRRSALESLQEARALAGRPADLDRIESLAVELGLDPDSLRRRPRSLSGGQQQRVGIARALAAEPEMLIADEITSGLDRVIAWRLIDQLREIQGRGVGLLIITHDVDLLGDWVDELLILDGGHVVERGSHRELRNAATHAATRALLGE